MISLFDKNNKQKFEKSFDFFKNFNWKERETHNFNETFFYA